MAPATLREAKGGAGNTCIPPFPFPTPLPFPFHFTFPPPSPFPLHWTCGSRSGPSCFNDNSTNDVITR